jgi:putative membrane protein
MSWLFEMVSSLRQFILPLVALLFFGRSNGYEWWPLIGVALLALGSVVHYFTYRYRVEERSVVVRSGLLQRHLREIPFARIQNVAVHQTVLHRVFGVAEVRLESAGGVKPEAQMKVLKLDDALALEALVRRRGAQVAAPADAAAAGKGIRAEPGARTLLALPPGEVLRLGLVSNRGLLVLGGGFAAISQFDNQLFGSLMEYWGKSLFGWAESHHFDAGDYVLAAGSLVVAFLALMRALSVLIALLQYFGFRLLEQGRRLTVERGLLSRLRTSVPRRRIQAWALEEGLVHRLLRRRSLHVDTAIGNASQGGNQRGFRDLAPIATPAACDELVRHLLPQATWPMTGWTPMHRLAWVRLATPGIVASLGATALLCLRFGPWGALTLAWLPWAVFAARRHAARAGYARDQALVAWRAGWWSRSWRFAEVDKLQAMQLSRSPIDRLYGMATLHLDSAGAGAFGAQLRMRYLPESDARALCRNLGAEVARRKLRW